MLSTLKQFENSEDLRSTYIISLITCMSKIFVTLRFDDWPGDVTIREKMRCHLYETMSIMTSVHNIMFMPLILNPEKSLCPQFI